MTCFVGRLARLKVSECITSKCGYSIRSSVSTAQTGFDISAVNSYSERSHNCGQLSRDDVGKCVTLYGWIQYTRFNNKIIAIRDSYGVTQCIVDQEQLTKSFRKLAIHNESVVRIVGQVRDRPASEKNDHIPTGEIEVLANRVEILSQASKNLPMLTRESNSTSTLVNRLKHRYLDLRSEAMQDALRLRSKICHIVRNELISLEFVECETPTLFNRTPGGANEFIVPTQEAGKFYSLVQSPQQLKQLLMIGGLDRYFQICRCYRDEPGRSDRQPEFTQVDIELSFTNQDLVMSLIEKLMYHLLTRIYDDPHLIRTLTSSFDDNLALKRISYREAFSKYGTDKPDTRFNWCIETHEDRSLYIDIPYSIDGDKLQQILRSTNLASIPISSTHEANQTRLTTPDGSDQARKVLGATRLLIAAELTRQGEKIYKRKFDFLWITDFPLFTENKLGQLEPNHHPFTAPSINSIHLLRDNPSAVIGQHYDLVLNGQEIAGGSMRINDADLQSYIFGEILKVDDNSFGYFVEALRCGCPPHGGIAIGLDRLIAILMDRDSIKEVIAFPKTSAGRDLMTDCPQEIGIDVKNLYHMS